MTKSLTSLWLKSIRRVNKAQQAQGSKLFKSLLKPVKVPKALKPRPLKAAQILKKPKPAARMAKPRSKPATAPKIPATSLQGLPGRWQKSIFTLPGVGLASARRMLYWLYLPSGVVVQSRALVVMLHGCKQSATDFAISTRMNQLAEKKGFAVLYPQQSATADAHRCWHWYKRATQQGQGDVSLIAEMVRQVQRKHGLDATRTYVAGLSAGAGLAAILALRHPQLIAAAGLHSAPVFGTADSPLSGFQAMQQGASLAYRERAHEFAASQPQFTGIAVMLIHGRSDPVVRRVNIDQLTTQFAIVNAPLLSSSEPVQRAYAGRSSGRKPLHAYKTSTYYAGRKPQVVKCEIDALGHAWSGGDASVPFSVAPGPDATQLLWSFFSQHQRVQTNPVLKVA
ncbi:MAG: extracellular catalytic domain type 1 short-chain-length polyhydroxyalkanoate depolymerase [Polaromonas sp.]